MNDHEDLEPLALSHYVAHSQTEAEAWDEVMRYEDELAYFEALNARPVKARAEVDAGYSESVSSTAMRRDRDAEAGIDG